MDVILLKINGVNGNCTINGHANEIILNSYQHGVSLPMSMDPGNTERTAGRPAFSEFVFSKMTDQSTPTLYAACASGKKLGDAIIEIGRNENGNFMSLMKYTLTNSMVSNISTGGGGGMPSDSFSLNYTKIKTQFTQQNPDSSEKGKADFGWDLEANKAA